MSFIRSLVKRFATVPRSSALENAVKYIPNIKYARVSSVYDGDTITIAVMKRRLFKSDKIYLHKVRIAGIDCPELRGSSSDEKTIAVIAKQFVVARIDKQVVKLDVKGYDKYGRILASVYYNNNSNSNSNNHNGNGNALSQTHNFLNTNYPNDIAADLLEEGLAVLYEGKTKQVVDWKDLYYRKHFLNNSENKTNIINEELIDTNNK